MHSAHIRRYLFVVFETLQDVKFKKLEKVSDKIFVLVGSDVKNIPFLMVKEVQKMGNNLKWIEVNSDSPNDLNYHTCFLMGKLHERISGDVEFAILSDDDSFDPLVSYINTTGRSCLRVRQKQEDVGSPPQYNASLQVENVETPLVFPSEIPLDEAEALSITITPDIIEETAKDTIRRLMRSGNRPSELILLKNYILLHNQALVKNGTVDKVISRLEESQNIEILDDEVIYHF